MNRGGARRAIFHTAGDGSRFVDLVGETAERQRVTVLAYCLMSNHFHLLVTCPEGGLSAFMHRIGALYARHHNDRLGRDGPIFRGRFHSLLIDSEEYLACAGRYIHRNPLDVRPPQPLDEYRWSSYRYYVTDLRAPDWLSTAELLSPLREAAAYRTFVEDCHDRGPLDWAVDTAILEADDEDVAVASIRRTVILAMLDRADGRTVERLVRLVSFPSDGARRAALHRSRKHLDEHPGVLAIVERALRLAA
jgi:REP element-mobilizing transposase RayT